MPLDECYVDGYPEELDIFKLLLELVVIVWMLGALVISVFNVISIWWKIGSND